MRGYKVAVRQCTKNYQNVIKVSQNTHFKLLFDFCFIWEKYRKFDFFKLLEMKAEEMFLQKKEPENGKKELQSSLMMHESYKVRKTLKNVKY